MGFEPCPPDCSGRKVSGLQHGATTPSWMGEMNCTSRFHLFKTQKFDNILLRTAAHSGRVPMCDLGPENIMILIIILRHC